MNTIAQKIASLRKEAQMTQEELAAILGVSAQTVSKWETNTTMPDILLLPLIADTFSVTVDTLFERGDAHPCEPLSFQDVAEEAHRKMVEVIHRSFPEERSLDTLFAALKGGAASAVYNENGDIAYVTDRLGVVVKKTGDGICSLFENEKVAKLFSVFADENVKKVILHWLKNENVPYSAAALSKKLALSKEVVEGALNTLDEIGMVEKKPMEMEDGTVVFYQLWLTSRVGPLVAMFACAERCVTEREYYYGFRGTFGKNF